MFLLNVVDLAILDPPYGLNLAVWDKTAWGERDFKRILEALTSSSSNQDMAFICFIAIQQYHHLKAAIDSCGWHSPEFITLYKKNKNSAGGKRFTSVCEYMVICFRSSSDKHIWNYRATDTHLRTNMWEITSIGSGAYISLDTGKPVNPCQKPQVLLKRILLRHHSTPGGLILDICAGSHSLMFACLDMDRSCVSIESDDTQHLAAVQRMRSELQKKNSEEKEKLEKSQGDGEKIFDPNDGKSIPFEDIISSADVQPSRNSQAAKDSGVSFSQQESSFVSESMIADLENVTEMTQPFSQSDN